LACPDHQTLVAQAPFEHRTGRRIDDEMVGVDVTGDHGFAKPRRRVDDRLPAPAGHRVGGEHDTSHGRLHQVLDDHRQTRRGVVDAVGRSVHHGPVRPQRRPAPVDRIEDGFDTHDVQIGVLLAGEAGER
jgi:hypothetical protein